MPASVALATVATSTCSHISLIHAGLFFARRLTSTASSMPFSLRNPASISAMPRGSLSSQDLEPLSAVGRKLGGIAPLR